MACDDSVASPDLGIASADSGLIILVLSPGIRFKLDISEIASLCQAVNSGGLGFAASIPIPALPDRGTRRCANARF